LNPQSQIISNTILQKRNKVLNYEQNIKLIEEQIIKLKKDLFQTCKHNWVRDWDDRSCHSSWVCEHCKLYKNPNYN
jgi:hypothetical protein